MSDGKELKDQRIPIMMSESEVTAIDDWAFERRIRSRGEAIRRLCQIGLMFEEQSEYLMIAIAKAFMDIQESSAKLREASNAEDLVKAYAVLRERNLDFFEEIVLPLTRMRETIETMGSRKNISDAMEEIEKFRRFMKAERDIVRNRQNSDR